MFDFSFGELTLFAVIALVVLGPEKLPHAARMAGAWVGRIRRSVISIQAEIEKEVAQQEMRERIEKEMQRIRESDLAQELKKTSGEINEGVLDAGKPAAEATLQPPAGLMTALPPGAQGNTETAETPEPEKPGEEAFKAFVNAGHQPVSTDQDTLPHS
jgi:sec-independent protein translocase protein TatB